MAAMPIEVRPITGALGAVHHPFTSPHPDDVVLLDSAPHTARALAYDVVLNGTELGSGSIRIHRQDIQSKIFRALGMTEEEARSRFGFFLEALEYGTPPHGGIASGIERTLMVLVPTENIRDVMAFPKTASAQDLMIDAPGEVDVNTAFLDQSGLAVGDTATVNTGTAQVAVRVAGEVFDPDSRARMYGSTQTLPGVASPANVEEYDVALRPGVSADCYVNAVNGALGGNPWQATSQQDGEQFYTIAGGLVSLLALMVAVAAGLGVLNTVLMTTRDRVHDLGVFKALGMRPGQVLTMVVCWIAGPAVVAAAIAAPAPISVVRAARIRRNQRLETIAA